MSRKNLQAVEGKTRREIVKLLKTEGAMDSAQLAERLGLTAMAIRQHLYSLQNEKLVTAVEKPVPFGRPVKHWRLTQEADKYFPEAYAELSVSLIRDLEDAFGKEGLERLIDLRCKRQDADYKNRITESVSLKDKLKQLVRIRTEEGYMAEVKTEKDGSYLLVENHCPICAAATICQGFCSKELDIFRNVLGSKVQVERVEHIISGARRCAYRISHKK